MWLKRIQLLTQTGVDEFDGTDDAIRLVLRQPRTGLSWSFDLDNREADDRESGSLDRFDLTPQKDDARYVAWVAAGRPPELATSVSGTILPDGPPRFSSTSEVGDLEVLLVTRGADLWVMRGYSLVGWFEWWSPNGFEFDVNREWVGLGQDFSAEVRLSWDQDEGLTAVRLPVSVGQGLP